MPTLSTNSIAVDCPDPTALATFYAELLNVKLYGDYVLIQNDQAAIWFQPVENYQAPTWPTQERGQQVHFDLVVKNVPAAARRAELLGASRSNHQPGDGEWVVMLDPAGHPFCIALPFDNIETPLPEESDIPMLAAIDFDCADGRQLWDFYHQLADLTPQDINGAAPALIADTGLLILVQEVEGYQSPTWPTQERGQQIHIDFHTAERSEMVNKAISLGAELKSIEDSFTVLTDPAGHPFCICDLR